MTESENVSVGLTLFFPLEEREKEGKRGENQFEVALAHVVDVKRLGLWYRLRSRSDV